MAQYVQGQPSTEAMLDMARLGPMSTIVGVIARIRSELEYATYEFFNENHFVLVPTPIITTNDCEGAGKMFQVTTMIRDAEKLEKELKEHPPPSEADLMAAELAFKEKNEAAAQLKSAKASEDLIDAAVAELGKAKENFVKLEGRYKLGERFSLTGGIPKTKDGNEIDYAEDFVSKRAFLTAPWQLQVKGYPFNLPLAYSFGPKFRAEKLEPSRQLAEVWTVEPEMMFSDIEDNMNYAEKYVRFLCQWLLDHCHLDMEYVNEHFDGNAIERLKLVAESKFHRITYTDAVATLGELGIFDKKVEWGTELASEHERYLIEDKFKAPFVVYNYPKDLKAFYMKVNEDSKSVAAMDVFVPMIGKLISGGQKEDDCEVLKQRILEMGLPLEPYQWYIDLLNSGLGKHSGFSLVLEQMVMLATGVNDARLISLHCENSLFEKYF